MKKIILLIALLIPGLCFADVCPTSLGQAQSGYWVNKFKDRFPNFNRFQGAVWRQGSIYCAYKDKINPPNLAVIGKRGYVKPAYSGLWQKNPNGIVCTASVSKCNFSPR